MFTFAHLTDSHVYSKRPPAWNPDRDEFVRHSIRVAAEAGADFILHTGDFCTFGADAETFRHVKAIYDEECAQLGIPWHIARGNHDTSINDAEFCDVFGPSNFHFLHKGWAFIVMDRYWKGYERLPHYYDMSHETILWLQDALQAIPRGMPTILALHENPIGITSFHKGDLLLNLFKDRNVRMVLFGHVQCNYLSSYAGVPHRTVVGDAQGFDSEPLSYAIVTCDDKTVNAYDIRPYTFRCPPLPSALSAAPAASPAVRLGEEWRDGRGTSGTRAAAAPLPSVAPALRWKTLLRGRIAAGTPGLADGRLYIGTQTRGASGDCTVTALSAATGDIAWQTFVDGGVTGGILPAMDSVFCGSTNGTVYRLDANTGTVLWQWNNGDNLPFGSQPVLHDGLLHTGANWEMYALRAATGELVWRKLACRSGVSYFSPGHASPLVIGDRVFHQRPYNGQPMTHQVQSVLAADGGGLQLSDPACGVWPTKRHSSPLNWNGKLLTTGHGLTVFDPADLSKPLLHISGPECSATAAVSGATAVVSFHERIEALDLGAGRASWSVEHMPSCYHFGQASGNHSTVRPSRGNYSAPLIAGDTVLVCDTAGHARAFATANGAGRWDLAVGGPIVASPIVSGNTLVLCTYDGAVLAYTWEKTS
jgi:outer membrane protein assembly factor BamB